MKGYLKKTKEGWFVVYDQRTFYDPSAEDGILPLSPKTALYFDINLTSTILLNKEIEFEIINLTDDKYGIELSYAQLITTDSKKDRTCNHTNCREICPECKLPSDILENVISSQPDWNKEPLNSFGEEEGVWQLNLEQELNKLPYTKHLDDGQYNDGVINGFELGATWCYNKTKEKYEVESSVRELHQYKLGLEDGFNKAKEYFYTKQDLIDFVESLKNYTKESHTILGHDDREPIEFVNIFLQKISDEEALNLVKKLNKQLMVDSQFTISDDVLFEQAIVAMEEIYGSGCETEIDAYFRGAKWILKQFKK